MQQRARSIYRQVRMTVTEERGGSVSVRVMVKPMEADWTMKHTVWVASFRPTEPTTHWSELVLAAAEEVLSQRLFPHD